MRPPATSRVSVNAEACSVPATTAIAPAEVTVIVTDTEDEQKKHNEYVKENSIVVINKIDQLSEKKKKLSKNERGFPVSAKTGEGLTALIDKLHEIVEEKMSQSDSAPITRERHRMALEKCREALEKYLKEPQIDLAAENLRIAARELGRILGKIDVEELLDKIFKDFCIGK